jgi:choline dehydrogenase-like flavoprotein
MGSASDPDAVVDQSGRVHGVTSLRVVDASIMPTIPRANTHLSCVMIAERIAEWMRKEQV